MCSLSMGELFRDILHFVNATLLLFVHVALSDRTGFLGALHDTSEVITEGIH